MNKKRESPLTDAFIESLKLKMKDSGLKQTELASFLGKPRQIIQSWWTRKKSPNTESTLKIQAWDKLK